MILIQPCILLVTDDEEQCLLFTLVLERAGYQIVSASACEEALVRLACCHCDVLLTDYYLPGTTGKALINTVQQQYPRVKTILMSNCSDVRELADACHADDWYPKTEIPLLLSTLSRVLPQRERLGLGVRS